MNKRTDEYKSVFGNSIDSHQDGAGTASWGQANQGQISALIRVATSRGGAIRFGYTRDGGAYALGLYFGTEHVTKYCRPGENLQEFLETWMEFYEKLPDTHGVSPQTPK